MQLTGLKFDNSSLHGLPVEVVLEGKHVEPQRQVKGACWSRVKPEPVKSPALVAASLPCLALLDLKSTQVRSACHATACTSVTSGYSALFFGLQVQDSSFIEYFSGNKLLPGSETAAHCYAGHQFGHFSGQLGDGAAIYLGEVLQCLCYGI